MAYATSFEPFPALPKEIRLLIWEIALSAPTAVFAREQACPDRAMVRRVRRFDLPSQGVVPHKIGQSCREAWKVMEDTCLKLAPESRVSDSLDWIYWLNPNCTIFVLDEDFVDLFALNPCLGADTLLQVKKVALIWRYEEFVPNTCRALQENCPALDSIFLRRIQGSRRRRPADGFLKLTLSGSFKIMAADDAMLLAHPGKQPALLTKLIRRIFCENSPRLHFITH